MKSTKINEKETGIGPYLKKVYSHIVRYLVNYQSLHLRSILHYNIVYTSYLLLLIIVSLYTYVALLLCFFNSFFIY